MPRISKFPGRCREKKYSTFAEGGTRRILVASRFIQNITIPGRTVVLWHDAAYKEEKIVVFHGTQQGEFYDTTGNGGVL